MSEANFPTSFLLLEFLAWVSERGREVAAVSLEKRAAENGRQIPSPTFGPLSLAVVAAFPSLLRSRVQ